MLLLIEIRLIESRIEDYVHIKGWNAGQLGPVLPDLQVITNTTLDEASYYLTSLSLGFLLGALVAGWIFRKGHQMITMSTLTAVFAILTATDRVLATYISVLTLSSFGLMITTLYQKDIGVWIFVPMSGFCQSILFPLLLSWIEEDFFKVTGKIVSVIMFLGSIGTMNPNRNREKIYQ
ncbi:uncharacterized protein LOC127705616 [Mytilus californianus]|uniref:uncharacterized protein LOC127705616 n=1 Tax=Mytilus californianus TaxID=6549 RepID=UPI0022452A66|nr:uncharacterized protein LOC127705616 [Mytilus californianus]